MGYSGQPWISTLRKHLRDYSIERDKPKSSLLKQGAFRAVTKRGEAVIACASYTTCSVLLTLANKAIFSENKLNFPWMLLGVQSGVVALLLMVYYSVDRNYTLFKRDLLRQMLLPCVFFTCFIFTNARALRYISLPVLTVIKSMAPMGVALAERVMFKEKVSFATYGAMMLIVGGNGVTALHDMEFDLVGYAWAFVNVIMNIAYVISLRYCLSNSYSTGEKTLHSNTLACAFIFPLALACGEWPEFVLEFNRTSGRFKALFMVSCVLAAGIGASVFWVITAASGSTLSFVGASNKVLVVILGAALFETRISAAGWAGVGMGTVAGFVFALSKAVDVRRRKGAAGGEDGGGGRAAGGLLEVKTKSAT
ncbi:GDP-mannose transporter [Gracilariopsis chorda]|uniref:GDP-mannose transporter n=1 Tax=Gracilariopsis chorda TaxID=448386 RepID=A0A2V3IZ47_9FLOR|nr:GDP-mannose transporter [Gracilariopsis chorda]|eukprot:PXF46957.1 GDP-mannose transporter [Gracilariopsis chorda]